MTLQKRYKEKIDTFVSVLNQVKNLSISTTKKVACIALKKDFSKIESFGYNGSFSGAEINPITNTEEDSLFPGESGFIHAEENMLIKFRERDPQNYIVLITLSPCLMCAKKLINAGFNKIYWIEDYRDSESSSQIFKRLNIWCGNINALKNDYIAFVSDK